MKMTLKQTKLFGLTMELELKAKEYKVLCEKFETLKNDNFNFLELENLKKDFFKNQEEIKNINKQLKALKN